MASNEKWEEVDYSTDGEEQKALKKDFSFDNFAEALSFVNKVGEIAEEMQHHPDIKLGWGYVQVWTTSHSEHKITDKDHKLAKAIDALL